ncbi:substrate-binding domain-containing protein [Sulfitobacter sp. F26169L]|uniref:LacI family DNA-binding transcriptional regulator n=1 Tax=Sulfitobacter sp. F26169L TaxID=2996015 RepID=UPI002260DA43|nr:substrate-binding domain-containing protein [Sulfitobacter sp. F26169L]MCX7567976.1 substrate-binding domain-containing protein [Sulfitobacter sp. F26169L]
MEKKKKPRLSDVALLAGVSIGSASKALSEPDKVRPDTLARVKDAVQRLGYIADGTARALASRRSRTVGTILPTISNPIYAAFVQALQKQLAALGYHLIVASHEYDDEVELDLARGLIERGADALVLIGSEHHPRLSHLLDSAEIPTVAAWSYSPFGAHPFVGFNDRTGGQIAVRHLLGLGHRRFAILSGPTTGNERQRARISGIIETLSAHGLECPPDCRLEMPFSISSGDAAFRAVQQMAVAPTALVCCSDLLALGFMSAAAREGLRIPDQMSVTGFGDIEIGKLVHPALTTVRVPIEEIGTKTASMVVELIANPAAGTSADVEVDLAIRASTGPA